MVNTFRPTLAKWLTLNVRGKVILPYLLLTLVVTGIGLYVVMTLVSGSLSDRLNTQLVEAGHVVSDSVARREISHVEAARLVAYTRGLDEALNTRDQAQVAALAQPVGVSLGTECLILLDADGQEMFHLLQQADGTYQNVTGQFEIKGFWIAQTLLESGDPDSLPRRALGEHPSTQTYYYFTAIPVGLNNQVVGVVIVGTSLKTLLATAKLTALADVTVYLNDGEAVATTLALEGESASLLKDLGLTAAAYQTIMNTDTSVSGEAVRVHERWYRVARGPLRIGNDKVGGFAVALPLNFIIQANTTSRWTYTGVFFITLVGVVLIGYLVARRITYPLSVLVRTSQAVAQGDLQKRSGLHGSDEIGVLANTFDKMTANLEERTAELEKAYHTLEKLDQTKSDFIEVAAHELRTPLTLIKGHAQLLELQVNDDPEALASVNSIVGGAERMLGIINGMLDVTIIKYSEVALQPVLVGTLATSLEHRLTATLAERHLTLRLQELTDLPPVKGDPKLLQKLLHHLVNNAIKYTPDGGSITVSGRLVNGGQAQAEVELVVSDTGIGIDPDHHELIFEKFYQTGKVSTHSSGLTKFKGGGPGLGLAIVRDIVMVHHGRVWVESAGYDEEKCPGSSFYVRLPVWDKEQDEMVQ